ncbi:hypothetical protein Q31b_37990 [Novipirellula aureliae]|uniref:Uncharacterized protein n=1 Tax=Novipirellula aureliae TaxID=2527966 RepID=A0A5C6DT89_9BACT|nr:hypothetical protein Q31b_37990 [Novipirellula aureliae]
MDDNRTTSPEGDTPAIDVSASGLRPENNATSVEVIDDVHESARRRYRAKRPKEESNIAYNRRRHFGETPFTVIIRKLRQISPFAPTPFLHGRIVLRQRRIGLEAVKSNLPYMSTTIVVGGRSYRWFGGKYHGHASL